MRARLAGVSAFLIGLVVSLALPAVGPGCGPLCQCDPDTVPLPTDGEWALVEVEYAHYFDGGDSDEWAWDDPGSPLFDVSAGTLSLSGGALTMSYETDQGGFRVSWEDVPTE